MRLARVKRSLQGLDPLADGPPPVLAVTPELERLYLAAYHRLHQRALDHAERYLSADDAQDAVADAMMALWRRWPALSRAQRSDRYIFGVVHYCVLAKLRTVGPLVSLEHVERELEQHAMEGTETPSTRDTAFDVLDLVLAAMPKRRREVFLLVHEHSLTYKEAAAELGLSTATINAHVSLAHQDLRRAFTSAGFRLPGAKPLRQLLPTRGASND